MKLEITNGLVLTDEHAASSYGIPVLVTSDGTAFGKADKLPEPWCAAGYDKTGNHTGLGEDKCRLAGAVVRNFAQSIEDMDQAKYAWVKSFFTTEGGAN